MSMIWLKRLLAPSRSISSPVRISPLPRLSRWPVPIWLPIPPVILAEDKVTAVASADALDGLYGVTAEDAASGEDAIIYLSGEFFADELVLPAGMAAADVEVALRNIGIYLK